MVLPLLGLQSTRKVPQEARGKVSSLNEYRHERMTEEREKRDGTEKQIEYGVHDPRIQIPILAVCRSSILKRRPAAPHPNERFFS